METVVITGASDGIGAAAARQLRDVGVQVVLVGCSREKTNAVALELGLPYHVADFLHLADVRRLADELMQYAHIDVLANNAGGILGERTLTEDGFEATFQLNHLAPFLLTRLLLPKLLESSARVIQTSSLAANVFGAGFDVDDLQNANDYTPTRAYGHGKLANILFTRELHRRHHADGLAAVAFHPGVVRTNFASQTSPWMRAAYHTPLRYLFTISPDASARRLTALATGLPGQDWQSGAVYAGRRPMPVRLADPDGSIARRLWDESERMVAAFL